eukprot:2582207-Rhodomonas_salina.2
MATTLAHHQKQLQGPREQALNPLSPSDLLRVWERQRVFQRIRCKINRKKPGTRGKKLQPHVFCAVDFAVHARLRAQASASGLLLPVPVLGKEVVVDHAYKGGGVDRVVHRVQRLVQHPVNVSTGHCIACSP